jgi:hypothetical protein
MHLRDPNTLFADRLVKLYADLADKKAVPSANLGPIFVRFSVQNALTKEELLYAIETTLELNNLAVIHLDDNKVRVGHISEISKSGRK